MAISDEMKALKALVAKINPERREGEYNPGDSPEWARRRALALWAYDIHARNTLRSKSPRP